MYRRYLLSNVRPILQMEDLSSLTKDESAASSKECGSSPAMTLDPFIPGCCSIIEHGFSGFHSGAGLWMVTRQLELSQPGWFEIPEHQSPIKMRQNLLIVHTLNLV